MNNTTWNDSRFGPGSYEHASQEDRSVPRTRVHIAASVRPSGGRGFQTIVRDLSLGGCTATSAARLEEHTFCWLTIPGFDAIQGEVVWWEAGLFGVAFAALLDPDSFDAIIAWQRNGTGPDVAPTV
jgi:hypothetical protein